MIDLPKETKGKLQYNKKLLEDLEGFISDFPIAELSKDCQQGIKRDLEKFNKNINYYEEILKILEDK